MSWPVKLKHEKYCMGDEGCSCGSYQANLTHKDISNAAVDILEESKMPDLPKLGPGKHRRECDWLYCRIRNEYNTKIDAVIREIMSTL